VAAPLIFKMGGAASHMKRLFLSFSANRDATGRDFVRQLFDRLQQQDIDPWVFESPRGEIQTGASISDTCRRKIEECDIFVVFIDDRALQSDFVNMEVSHALWDAGRRSLPIVPLIATLKLRREWPVAMAEATDFKGIALPADPFEALEAVVVQVCERLNIGYVPPKPNTPRLPLRQRLSQELQGKQSLSAYQSGDFIALLRKADLAVEAIGQEDYRKARRLLEAILTDLELQYGIVDAYYPRIAYGAVLMAEAHAGRRAFLEVEKYFAALIEDNGDRLDANAFAGRANALMALDRFAEALAAYQAAESYLETPDSALFYNMVRARVLGRLSMDPAEIRRRQSVLDKGIATRVPGDLSRLTSSVSLAYAYVGDTEAALRAWRDVGDLQAVFPELVVDIAHTLYRHAAERRDRRDLAAAYSVMADYITHRSDLTDAALLQLRQLLARVMFDRGERRQARQQLANLVEQFPLTPVLRIDAAMFALADGDKTSARQLCEAVVSLSDQSQCDPPLSSREFNFALGHAFWLLGKRSEAKESFRRSAHSASWWYDVTMPGEFGSLC
jgi:tetratricopeptide (TPR) repeat protein